MDYRESVDTIKFHALYSDLNGAEAKIIMLMLSGQNYKTGIYSASYSEIAEILGIAKTTVSKAIAGLIEKQAVTVIGIASGRAQSRYKLRSADDLYAYFTKEEKNATLDAWYEEEQKFDYVSLEYSKAFDYEECDDCKSVDELCERHDFQRKKIEATQPYKDWQLWLKDNPKPEYTIKTVKGRPLIK